MPTGYTAGILDGTITDFKQFAKICMRAFGATIMMRDEPLDKEWEPRTPSEYHKKELSKANADLSIAKESPDNVILAIRHNQLIKERSYYRNYIKKTKGNKLKLNRILIEANKFVPPTKEHDGFKDFMIEQLKSTIEFDGNVYYYENKLKEVEFQLKNLNVSDVRKDMIESAEKSIKYHEKEYEADLKRCKESNEWVQKVLESIK